MNEEQSRIAAAAAAAPASTAGVTLADVSYYFSQKNIIHNINSQVCVAGRKRKATKKKICFMTIKKILLEQQLSVCGQNIKIICTFMRG